MLGRRFAAGIRLREGYVDNAPAGPFDAVVCLLTLPFVPAAERSPRCGGCAAA